VTDHHCSHRPVTVESLDGRLYAVLTPTATNDGRIHVSIRSRSPTGTIDRGVATWLLPPTPFHVALDAVYAILRGGID